MLPHKPVRRKRALKYLVAAVLGAAAGALGAKHYYTKAKPNQPVEWQAPRHMIENWLNAKNQEMVFARIKGKPGIVPFAEGERTRTHAFRKKLTGNERALIQIHPYSGNKKLDRMVSSNPSPEDIQIIVRNAEVFFQNNPGKLPMLRTIETHPLNEQGKEIGNLHVELGFKALKRLENLQLIDMELNRWAVAIKENGVEQMFPRFIQSMARLQELGLIITARPRYGYKYEDGYFQPIE